jgi:hypothetical protein
MDLSRDKMIIALSQFGKLKYLHFTARARSEYYECYFNFCSLQDALKFNDTKSLGVVCASKRLSVERHDKYY